MEKQILIAGFGGQGILFAGKFLAYAGLNDGRQLSWLPSYGPEMRGGTANCSIILSDGQIGSPLVTKPDILAVLNLPSLEKYELEVKTGGQIYVNSTLISRKVTRTDVETFYVPATQMAGDYGLGNLANMIMMGSMLKHSGLFPLESVKGTLEKIVSPEKAVMFAHNIKAIELGYHLQS